MLALRTAATYSAIICVTPRSGSGRTPRTVNPELSHHRDSSLGVQMPDDAVLRGTHLRTSAVILAKLLMNMSPPIRFIQIHPLIDQRGMHGLPVSPPRFLRSAFPFVLTRLNAF